MGKGGQKEQTKSSTQNKAEVLIDSKYYDVSNLKHPVFNIIFYCIEMM